MTREEIIQAENLVYKKPELLNDVPMHYCPGCSHGVVHKLVSEVIAEMGMADKTIAISPVGCAVFAYKYIDVDWQEAAHGHAHFGDDLRHQFMDYAVAAARAIMHRHVIEQFRFFVNQVLRLNDFFFSHKAQFFSGSFS